MIMTERPEMMGSSPHEWSLSAVALSVATASHDLRFRLLMKKMKLKPST